MRQRFRLGTGGLIDRTKKLRFCFDGKRCEGYFGDTLASALLANGVNLVGRSFKYHRPRGVLGNGAEEANALVQLEIGAATEPNLKATQIELYDGLVATSQNCWPSLRCDVGALADRFSSLMPAGFYYKTFLWPAWSWFEPAVRRAAGLGRAPAEPDPACYESRFDHTDVLIVGAGPTGLAATEAALQGGRSVLLVDDRAELGATLGDCNEGQVRARLLASIERARNGAELNLLTRTTAIALYDHKMAALVERLTDHHGPQVDGPRQRLRLVRAETIVLATGAIERPLLFPNNDRPGIMLASASLAYRYRFAVMPARKVVVHTGHDSAYETAFALASAGATCTIVDLRKTVTPGLLDRARAAEIEVVQNSVVSDTHGRHGLRRVWIESLGGGRRRRLNCDLLAMSGGWTPSVHLHSQAGGRLRYETSIGAFIPGSPVPSVLCAGALRGLWGVESCVADGAMAGESAARRDVERPAGSTVAVSYSPVGIVPSWRGHRARKVWVDFQNDVTVADVQLAASEGLLSIEHVKRYTTLGMAVDQGKTANINGTAVLAEATHREIEAVGTTGFRPPYVPTTIGTFAGIARGDLYRPRRLLPAHPYHVAHGARLSDYGGWQRPDCYPVGGESNHAAARREALAVRNEVGLFDASPLGKIVVAGPDAPEFVGRIYANSMRSLQPGRLRYGLMLNEEGIIIDDGVLTRLAPDRYLIGTSSGGAARITDWLEFWRQCEWRHLRIVLASQTTTWATVTLAGPRAAEVLAALGTDIDLSSFPHLSFKDGHVTGVPARVARVSFTGEASYEISVPWSLGCAMWEHALQVGATLGITPVGVDAWMMLRIEKGFLHVGSDTDGETTPDDIGWGRAVRARTDDFIGRRSLQRAVCLRGERLELVGVEPLDLDLALVPGAHLLEAGTSAPRSSGFITSACDSPSLRRWVGLARVRNGRSRLGEVLRTEDFGRSGRVRLVEPHFYDREGARLHG